MCVSQKLSTTPAGPAANYAPPAPSASASTQRRQTSTTTTNTSTTKTSPPSRHHQNHRSRRRSRRARSLRARRNIELSDERRGTTGDGWNERCLDEQKGSDQATDTTQGAPTWWRAENEKRGYNRYAALSSTEEDFGFESQEYGSAGYGVGIIEGGGGGGLLALQRRLEKKKKQKCDDNDDEGRSDEEGPRGILLEQVSGIDAPDFLTEEAGQQQERRYADADADVEGYCGLKEGGSEMNMAPPSPSDFAFSFPSALTKTIIGMAMTKTTVVVAPEADPLPDLPIAESISFVNGNNKDCDAKTIILSRPFFCDEEFEQRSLSYGEVIRCLNKAGQTSAMLSNRRAFPAPGSRPRACVPLPKLVPPTTGRILLLTERIPVTPSPTWPSCIPLSKLIPPLTAGKLTKGRIIPNGSNSMDIGPAIVSLMKKSKEQELRYGLSSAVRNDGAVRGGWREQGCWMRKESGDPSSSSSTTTLISEGRSVMEMSRVFSTLCGGEDGMDGKVAEEEAEWVSLEYTMIPRRFDFDFDFGNGNGNGNGKFEVGLALVVAGFGDEGASRKVIGDDLFDGNEDEEEEEDLCVEVFREIEIENENGGGREGGELVEELESEMGGGWDVINRVDAWDG